VLRNYVSLLQGWELSSARAEVSVLLLAD
jgi:hypothetical protein